MRTSKKLLRAAARLPPWLILVIFVVCRSVRCVVRLANYRDFGALKGEGEGVTKRNRDHTRNEDTQWNDKRGAGNETKETKWMEKSREEKNPTPNARTNKARGLEHT